MNLVIPVFIHDNILYYNGLIMEVIILSHANNMPEASPEFLDRRRHRFQARLLDH